MFTPTKHTPGRACGILIVLSLFVFSQRPLAQEAWNVELLGHMGGQCETVFVRDNYVYMGEGLTLQIVDTTSPSKPEKLGRVFLPGMVNRVCVVGDYAYVAGGYSGLRVVNVSNPSVPYEAGHCSTRSYACDVYVSGNYAYIADYDAGLDIVNISDPANPHEVGHCEVSWLTTSVCVSGGYAYVVNGTSLQIIDVSIPSSPYQIGCYYDPIFQVEDVWVSANYAYLAAFGYGLLIINVSDPSAPYRVGWCDTRGFAVDVCVSGSFAYIADQHRGLSIINVNSPTTPYEEGYYDTPGIAESVYVSGNIVYVADTSGFRIINVSSPASPFQAGYYLTPSDVRDISVSGNRCFVADDCPDLFIVNVSNPFLPHQQGNYDTDHYAVGIYALGNYAYLVDGYSAVLRILDISNPSGVSQVAFWDAPGDFQGVCVSDNYVYVAAGGYGLRVVDISKPWFPREVGYCYIPDWAYDVYVTGNYAYVAAGYSGLRIVDVSNPAAPFETGFYDTPSNTVDVWVSGDYAYLADENSGLCIVSVSDPYAPYEAGRYDTPGEAQGVYVSGKYAYVADGTYGLCILDVSNPFLPHEAAHYDTPGSAARVFVWQSCTYLADKYAGLFILRFATEAVASYDFTVNAQEWTSHTVPLVFAEPSFTVVPGFLQISAHNNSSTFGYWQSPPDAVQFAANYLYRARFRVLSDQTSASLVPQIKLRVNASNFQQSDYLTIESSGDGGASPTRAGTIYDLCFVPPSNAERAILAFDMLNFNPEDAAQATLSLDSVLVERFPLDMLSTPTVVRAYEFTTSEEGWTTGSATMAFTSPQFIRDSGALVLRSTTNTNTFGFWKSDAADITIAPGRLYRGTFEVRTDVTNRAAVPQMWLQFDTSNLQASRTLAIESVGDGANSPATTNTTHDQLYFLPPANCVGDRLIVSFDMLNFSPDDAPTGSLIFDRATIESLAPPSSP